MRYLILILLALLLSATPARAGHDLTAAWAPPYGYAVVWRGLAPDGACVVRAHPAPETVLGCDGQATYFLYVEDGTMGGMVFELRDGGTVLATATLGGRVALPDVSAP